MRKAGAEAIFDVDEEVELRESQGFKIKDLNKAQRLAEENRDLIIQKWNEHLVKGVSPAYHRILAHAAQKSDGSAIHPRQFLS